MSSNIDVSSDSGLQREQSLSTPGNTELSPTDCKVSKNFTGNYPYQPLQSNRHIRLLRLEPPASSSTQGNPISATLHEVKSIGYPPSFPFYTALSYEWGLPPSNPSDTPTILLDNYTIHIRQNLYDAIHSILHNHHRLYGESPLYLWVDALCINQLDDREKGHQVQLMKKIYQTAEIVIIWLGMGTDRTYRAMDVLNMEDVDLESYVTKEEEQGIVDLYCEATYWTRVWILQEFVLARDYVVLCNRAFVTKETFERGLMIHGNRGWRRPQAVFIGWDPNWPAGLLRESPVGRIVELRDSRHSAVRSPPTLARWLDTLCRKSFEATDHRDYVFAMLGISDDGDSIVPNYELSTWEVYCLAISARSVRARVGGQYRDFHLSFALLMGMSIEIVELWVYGGGLDQLLKSEDEEMPDQDWMAIDPSSVFDDM